MTIPLNNDFRLFAYEARHASACDDSFMFTIHIKCPSDEDSIALIGILRAELERLRKENRQKKTKIFSGSSIMPPRPASKHPRCLYDAPVW